MWGAGGGSGREKTRPRLCLQESALLQVAQHLNSPPRLSPFLPAYPHPYGPTGLATSNVLGLHVVMVK